MRHGETLLVIHQHWETFGHHPLRIPENPENYPENPENKKNRIYRKSRISRKRRISRKWGDFLDSFYEFSSFSGQLSQFFWILWTAFVNFLDFLYTSGSQGFQNFLDFLEIGGGGDHGWTGIEDPQQVVTLSHPPCQKQQKVDGQQVQMGVFFSLLIISLLSVI